MTQSWVGMVRQRLIFGGNYRTHRASHLGGNLTVVQGKLVNSAREQSVTTQSTAENGMERQACAIMADYQKEGYVLA